MIFVFMEQIREENKWETEEQVVLYSNRVFVLKLIPNKLL